LQEPISPTEVKIIEKELPSKKDSVESNNTSKISPESDNDSDIATLFPILDVQFVCTVEENDLIIKLSQDTSREVLVEIKTILEGFPNGAYHVWLDIGGQKIDTKKYIAPISST
jgi:hypothetical protein